MQTMGIGIPSLSALLQEGITTKREEASSEAQNTLTMERGDPSLGHLTLDEVQRARHEVHYEEVAHLYGGALSLAPVVTVRLHPEVVWVRPDMGIGMIANPMIFGIGKPPSPIQWRSVERSLKKGYLPIVISSVRKGSLVYQQVTYAILLEGGEVMTGHEKQALMVRMNMTNTDLTEIRHATLWAYVPAEWAYVRADIATPHGLGQYGPFGNYSLFEGLSSLPGVPSETLTTEDNVLRDGMVMLGVYEEDPGVTAKRHKRLMKFDVELLPGQTKAVNLKLSTNKKGLNTGELEKLWKLDFFTGLDQRELELERTLDNGTKIRVPEAAVNNIYKAQILYNQVHIVQAADSDYYMPVDSFTGVWPWSHMKQLVAMDEYGYHEDVRKSLIYFLKLQGKRPPNKMKVTSYEGVFPSSGTFEESGWEQDTNSTIYGRIAKGMEGKELDFPNWANNTGCILYAFGEHYFYTRDRGWLESVAPAVIKACDWIINQRQQTKTTDAQGQKELPYGLLPSGEPYDATTSQKEPYYFCFTDGFTYKGLKRAAEALADINHPDGRHLLKEADSYRDDILEVMRRTRRTDPSLPPYPEQLYGPDGWGSFATGAIALVDAGLLDPHDPAFTQLENYMKKQFNQNVLGLTGRCPRELPEGEGSSYYVVQSDNIYHYAWVLRGDVEKSLLTLYSALGLAVDKQTLCAVERILLYDRRYAPFSVNTFLGAELCSMIRRTLLVERDSELSLLPVAPRRWLEAGKKIEVEGAPTYFGKMSLKVESQVDKQKMMADLVLENDRQDRVRRISLRLPHPTKQPMQQVTVNGAAWKSFDREREVIDLQPAENRYRIVVWY
ncbi:MAG TPA: hypothetical protein VK302_20490 [Terriglobales bacterium]|nr:hypothetical protein [Terriglobales bacterium]